MGGIIGSSVLLYSTSLTPDALSWSVVDVGAYGLVVGREVFHALAGKGAELEVGREDQVGAWHKVHF